MSLNRIKLHRGKELILIKLDINQVKLVVLIRGHIAAIFLIAVYVYL